MIKIYPNWDLECIPSIYDNNFNRLVQDKGKLLNNSKMVKEIFGKPFTEGFQMKDVNIKTGIMILYFMTNSLAVRSEH